MVFTLFLSRSLKNSLKGADLACEKTDTCLKRDSVG
jgi:hypothetical protein